MKRAAKDAELKVFNTAESWYDANQRYLMASVETIREELQKYSTGSDKASKIRERKNPREESNEEIAGSLPAPSALENLSNIFSLSKFERDILLLCAGMELDPSISFLCRKVKNSPEVPYPTFSLALAVFREPHWSALNPASPLRLWQLIEIEDGETLTGSRLRINERVLHYLAGVSSLDGRLAGIVKPVSSGRILVPSHKEIAKQILSSIHKQDGFPNLPLIQLHGEDEAGKREIAANVCENLGIQLYLIRASEIPEDPIERNRLQRLWDREAFLENNVLMVEWNEEANPNSLPALSFLENSNRMTFISGAEPLHIGERSMIYFEVDKPTTIEQKDLWETELNSIPNNKNGSIQTLVSQFNLSSPDISSVSRELLGRLKDGNGIIAENDGSLSEELWNICQSRVRAQMGNLAMRINPVAGWKDLVLPEQQHNILREVAIHVRQRYKVYEVWKFAEKSSRGLGISALFAGVSGTGKTMAAEVLANELNLDLYRVDLSSVVSKYIGETEKNLRRVFDAAEEGGAILLFDEADALFGRRSEVKDSHDRYANIEVSYLLQRMEDYRGLAILTTNMKSALDTAFLRRIRFIVEFPFPDAENRAAIWKRVFPDETPTEGLDISHLSKLNIAGGNIKNIAMNAAFLAVDAGEPVRMNHLIRAAGSEYAKIEKTLTEAEKGRWI